MSLFSNHKPTHDTTAYQPILQSIRELQKQYTPQTDAVIKQHAQEMTTQIQKEPYTEQQRIAYFALVCEAASRTLGMNPFDVQILGGLALCDGKLIEMQTGEGKTLVAVLPACLQALSQQGVHILTFNDYLAKRDAQWMRPIYEWMGLTVAFVTESQSLPERQQAYRADITYATAKQAGFDYLRDHLCYHPQNLLHRTPHWAIVDEADSILIDEARVPLVIAGETTAPISDPAHLSKLIHSLDPQTDTETDEHKHNVYLTDKGLDKLEKALACGDLHTPQNLALLTDINCALYAHILLQRNIDYIVRQQKIEVVDEFTGRVAKDRRWPDGLQAALDAKEGLPIQPRGSTLGSITLQHFVKTYTHLGGMTATAQTASEEFKSCYDLDIVVIPPNRPCIRQDHPDILFTHKKAKQKALIEEITQTHQTGRPTLVGTSNVEESDTLAQTLQDNGIACHVLNAKNDEEEATIIANAGAWEAITISTNMAGRGTDIQLGGVDGQKRDAIIALGGLYVLGTNRHESLRIDNQLRGRAGRQGDPGASRFIICLKDHLIQRYGIETLIPKKHRPDKQDAPIDHPIVHREIARAQRIVEGQSADIRKTLWTYADIVEQHRQDIHQWRQDILNDKEPPPTFAEHAPAKFASIALSPEQIYQYEKHLTLSVIDKCWREYLTDIGHIREGIHLVSLGGQNPLDEFRKTIHQAFQTFNEKIEHEIQNTYESAVLTENGLQLDNAFQVPSTTWTYLVHDNNTLGKTIERLLVGNSNVGQAAGGALLLGPILFIMGVYRRFFKKSSR